MKLIFSLLTVFFLFLQSGLESLRNSYAKANSSNAGTEAFIATAEKTSGSDPVIQGYKAAAQIMKAKIAKTDRKAMVKSGATNLENVIKAHPSDIELRVIRLSIQENIPKIVGYRGSLKEDKTYILNNYGKQGAAMKNYIKRFAAQSKTMTPEERAALK
ncbi:hypothetical protein SD427_17305 [Chryseobacterium sp. JJR-5R]|uniref:hypothetical protein n=1 Tax=Chryseobacterium sp. JJR-5R TaxID=3093923 RepID=UPI002A74AADC|nr:hypothetical protein [Chryseobacterium sp. JJR-5R]WPO82496.1 hypothetical protein SD427_17305 [Chryseobacterium sp. JJR-5R]